MPTGPPSVGPLCVLSRRSTYWPLTLLLSLLVKQKQAAHGLLGPWKKGIPTG